MDSKAENVDETFWAALLAHILEGRQTPKSQVERAIGPILGFFLESAISDLLKSSVIMLAAEFPLKKENPSNLSTNVDWLMYDKENNELLLVELKTESTSFRSEQLEIYMDIAARTTPWNDMKCGFERICSVSKNGKYKYAQKQLGDAVSKHGNDIANASVAVLYLAPDCSRDLFDDALKGLRQTPDQLALTRKTLRFFSFSELADAAVDTQKRTFAPYRDKLYTALRVLDMPTWCEDDAGESPKAHSTNYQKRSSLRDMLNLCAGDRPVVVGFMGGLDELERQDVAHLESRLYKWDWADEKGVGPKDPRNWIDGANFIELVSAIRSTKLRTEADVERLVARIGDALRNNAELTLGQLIDRASRDAALALEDMPDVDLADALAALR